MTTQTTQQTIAFVLYPGLTPLDLVGPLQVFTSLQKCDPRFRAVVVAERIEPLESDIGASMQAERTFAEVPHPDVIFVPGGVAGTLRAMSDEAVRNYVRTAAETAHYVASVCTGSLILASVGLLDGRPATTHWAARGVLDDYGAYYLPKRWVDNGKIITAAGVSAGIDMALYLVEKLTDLETARKVQLDIEYDPQPPFGELDLEQMGAAPRAVRSAVTLAAPIMTRRPKKLSRATGWH
jgi:transcriptional regulator GlxA family with amidase domain